LYGAGITISKPCQNILMPQLQTQWPTMSQRHHVFVPSSSVLGEHNEQIVLVSQWIINSCFVFSRFSQSEFYSVQCIWYDNDYNIDNNAVQAKCEQLLGHSKHHLRTLTHSLRVKIFYNSPGQGFEDLTKEGIFSNTMEKEFIS